MWKIVLRCIFVVMVSINFIAVVESATYYVKDSGNDSSSGLSDGYAWKTIGKVNNFNFSASDIILFKRGSIFSDETLGNPGADNITFADYGTGEKPLIDGDKIAPISIAPSSPIHNLLIKNIDISGQDWSQGKDSNLYIYNVDGVVLSGIDGNGHRGGNTSDGKTAITVKSCSGEVVVENCNLYNWGPTELLTSIQDFMGIVIYTQNLGSYVVRGNIVHNVGADGIQLYDSSATGVVNNNVLYNCGEQCIDIKGVRDVAVYRNEFYRTQEFTGQGGDGAGGFSCHIDIHEGASNSQSENVNVYENDFHDGDAGGIAIARVQNVTIENNKFSRIATSIYIGNPCNGVNILNNTFIDSVSRLIDGFEGGCIYENNAGKGTKVNNNTVYNNGTCSSLLTFGCSFETEVFKNVLYQSCSNPDALCILINKCGSFPVIHENCSYVNGGSGRIRHGTTFYGDGDLDKWNQIAVGDYFGNPLFNDELRGDLRLKKDSLCKSGDLYWGALGAVEAVSLIPPSSLRLQE